MPTFSNIDGEESATVTFTVAAVSLTRNSSAELQEILCIGDPEVASSLGLARVTAAAPASTNAGLNVRILSGPSSVADFSVRAVLPSTASDNVVNVSSVAGAVIARSSAASLLASVYQSTAADLNVTVAGYSTTVNVSSLGGAVIARSSAASFLASVYQSTAADLNVTVAGYSTTVNVSSLAGAVIARSSAASFLASVYQSTAADLNVTVAGYSTTANVSSLAGVVTVNPASSAATGFYAVRLSDGSTFVTDSTERAIRVNVVAGSAAGDTTVTVMPGSSGATAFYAVRLSDGSTYVTDSTERAIRVNVVAGAAGGSTEMTVRQSTVGDLRAAVYQSTAADLNVTVAGYSTTVNVSSLAGAVIARSSAASFLASVYQSTITDLLASVQQNSTVWQVQAKIQDSSAVGFIGTTTRPTTGAQGLVVREVLNNLLSTCFSTLGNNSTSATVVSSAAGVRHKVYAYSITSTAQAVNTLSFASSLGNPIWQVQMQSVSSGITGANLAVSPPGWLFATEAASPLVFKIGSGTGTYHVSFSYFTEA